jgi:hypothetical protein
VRVEFAILLVVSHTSPGAPPISPSSQFDRHFRLVLDNGELIAWHFPEVEDIADCHSFVGIDLERNCLSLGQREDVCQHFFVMHDSILGEMG